MPFKGLAFHHRIGGGRETVRCLAACALVLLFFMAAPALSQSRVLNEAVLTSTEEALSLGPYTIIQKDSEDRITAQAIAESGGKILRGKVADSRRIFLGFDGVPVWLTIKIKNITEHEEWVLDFGRRRDGRIGSIADAQVYEMVLTPGATSAPTVRELKKQADNGAYDIRIGKNEQKFLLIHAVPSAGRPATLPLTIESDQSYVNSSQNRAVFTAYYCLALGAIALFFFVNAFTARRIVSVVFGVHFAYVAFFWVMYDTLGASLSFKGFNELVFALFLGHALLVIFMTKLYCGIGQNSYTEKYVIYGLIWLNVISSILFYFIPVGSGIAHILFLFGIPILTFSILTLLAYAQYKNGQVSHPYFAASFVIPLIAYIINVLSAVNVLSQESLFINAFWYAVIPQGLILIAAMRKQKSAPKSEDINEPLITREESSNFAGLRETKEKADHARLLKVIEKEREMLAELREKEAARVEEMKRAKEEADEANRAKSAFLAVVSHEIRTPMTGVMGMVKLLLDSSITKQQRDYALTIQESAEGMLALLNDILDLEKIQRGKMELEDISFDLHRLIQGVVTLMSGHAAEKHIGLSARMDEDIPKFVKGDPTRLRQVLLNLMGNAIKFTSEGSVTLIVKNLNANEDGEEAAPSSKYMIYFGVQDSGIGIPPEAQKNLFNPFSQANSSIGRKFGGTGLGLAISKGLIEAMGSTINISSREGEGSTFFFTLEMNKGLAVATEQAKPAAQAPVSSDPVEPLKILVVDDNVITRKVVSNLLQSGGHEIITAGTAEDALSKIYKDAFDLVLMDIELPGMRGNDATKILREHDDPVKSQIPVIAMTGNVQKENMELYLSCGMNGFLPKPIDPERLNNIVAEIASETYEREIRLPDDPFAMSKEELEAKEAPKKDIAIDASVFNPDMLQSLKDTIGGNQLDELLTDLIVKTDEILEAMQAAADIQDLATLAARAHELKGMAGNFGLMEISSIAAQAERKAKTQETDGLGALLGTLPDASTRAKSVLKEWSSH